MENIQGLIVDSDKLTDDLVRLTDEAYQALGRVIELEVELGEAKARFYLEEGSIDPPGGGKWNENKRGAYISSKYGALIGRLAVAEDAEKLGNQRIKVENLKLSGLNRKIRLLELASASSSQ